MTDEKTFRCALQSVLLPMTLVCAPAWAGICRVTTDGSGSFKIDLSTENGSLPAQVRPVSNIQRVNVIDSMGRTVLTGGPPV